MPAGNTQVLIEYARVDRGCTFDRARRYNPALSALTQSGKRAGPRVCGWLYAVVLNLTRGLADLSDSDAIETAAPWLWRPRP